MGHIMPLILYILLLFTLLFHLSLSQDLCHPRDKKILLRIKCYYGNPASLFYWDPNIDCCSWTDINCNEEGHVRMLRISGSDDIHGQIPPFIDLLPKLWYLSFNNIPNLSGPIPSSIANLTNLLNLDISNTNITAPIPDFLARLVQLTQLTLSSNGHTGPIPNFLGQLKSLTYLDLSNNKLTGLIPLALAGVISLEYLGLSSNELFGPIPDFLGQRLRNLITIDLQSNALSGSIPRSLSLLRNLTTLSLSSNRLKGSIPKWLGRANLFFLRLANNKFKGDASILFEKSNTAIGVIELHNNLLKFDFSKVDLARNLMGFNISHNLVYGSLPLGFGLLQVDSIDVSYNQLCGPIPNGRRFKRVNPSIFAHNKCLCGGPLPPCK